jgi:hypothetical protein
VLRGLYRRDAYVTADATSRRGQFKIALAVALFVIGRMLHDAPKRTIQGDHDRRWMSDDYFDLIVWYKPEGTIYGFQLCYGKPRWERALTWLDGRGFSHTEVDSGEDQPTRNRSPILVADGSFPAREVVREFEGRSSDLPKDLQGFVKSKIAEFVAKRNA